MLITGIKISCLMQLINVTGVSELLLYETSLLKSLLVMKFYCMGSKIVCNITTTKENECFLFPIITGKWFISSVNQFYQRINI